MGPLALCFQYVPRFVSFPVRGLNVIKKLGGIGEWENSIVKTFLLPAPGTRACRFSRRWNQRRFLPIFSSL
jgi:hypothetical protein